MLTARRLLDRLAMEKPHDIDTRQLIDALNDLEQRLTKVLAATTKCERLLKAEDGTYPLPAGVIGDDVIAAAMDGRELENGRDYRLLQRAVICPKGGESLVVEYRETPAAITEENLDTATLRLPQWHMGVYLYYLAAQIDLWYQNIEGYNQNTILYNECLNDYKKSLYENSPATPRKWRGFRNLW